jgi:hypothetical protein
MISNLEVKIKTPREELPRFFDIMSKVKPSDYIVDIKSYSLLGLATYEITIKFKNTETVELFMKQFR